MNASSNCPCCESGNVRVFHEMRDVPVNSVLLLPTRQEALEFPTGDIRLAFCPDCGFIYNDAFDASLLEYSERYEETQGYSPTFQRWHRQLAQDLIDRFELRGKRVVEIGCGKGEFLALLCERGGNTGVGFDPAYVPERNTSEAASRMEFVQDFYSEKYAGHQGDFVCCKMTLEHISNTADFVGAIRRSLEGQSQTQVFFQVPDTLRILEETAFWDVYYEHCSYFTAGSLARLFRRAGFDVQDVAREYGNQYLMIEAKPGDGSGGPQLEAEQDLQRTAELVEQFSHELPRWTAQWKERLDDWGRQGKRVVIWGSGSKGVSFLTTLGGRPDIEYVVDINPNKHGYFMARSGQEIVSPDFMTEYRPDVVVVMNPIYRDEIVADLERRNLSPEVVTT